MNNSVANKARRVLINLGKSLPFVICFIVFIGYLESLIALMTQDFLKYDDCVTLNTRLSFIVACYVKYDLLIVIVATILAYALETCKWHRYAVYYALIQLGEKQYLNFELEPTTIYLICLANIIIAGYLTYNGIKIILTTK